MTRHYTHTSEAAALSAVSSLPSIMTEDESKALPPAPAPRMVDVVPILEGLAARTEKNWSKRPANPVWRDFATRVIL